MEYIKDKDRKPNTTEYDAEYNGVDYGSDMEDNEPKTNDVITTPEPTLKGSGEGNDYDYNQVEEEEQQTAPQLQSENKTQLSSADNAEEEKQTTAPLSPTNNGGEQTTQPTAIKQSEESGGGESWNYNPYEEQIFDIQRERKQNNKQNTISLKTLFRNKIKSSEEEEKRKARRLRWNAFAESLGAFLGNIAGAIGSLHGNGAYVVQDNSNNTRDRLQKMLEQGVATRADYENQITKIEQQLAKDNDAIDKETVGIMAGMERQYSNYYWQKKLAELKAKQRAEQAERDAEVRKDIANIRRNGAKPTTSKFQGSGNTKNQSFVNKTFEDSVNVNKDAINYHNIAQVYDLLDDTAKDEVMKSATQYRKTPLGYWEGYTPKDLKPQEWKLLIDKVLFYAGESRDIRVWNMMRRLAGLKPIKANAQSSNNDDIEQYAQAQTTFNDFEKYKQQQ